MSKDSHRQQGCRKEISQRYIDPTTKHHEQDGLAGASRWTRWWSLSKRHCVAWKESVLGKQTPQTNAVHTSKYTLWSFIPKCLIYQFSRFSNVYFLSIGIMQLFPVISDSGGIPTALVPLAIVIVVSSIKDLIEDLGRHRSDAEENNRLTRVCVDGQVVTRRWQDLRVGDIVKIERGERIPADLVLLGTSGEYGVAYIETKSLDGETNLKHKVCIPEISQFFTCDEDASRQKVVARCEPPSAMLYEFSGSIERIVREVPPFTSRASKTQRHRHRLPSFSPAPASASRRSSVNCQFETLLEGSFALGLGQFFHRGSSLINTTWIYGLVVYVSKDTRILQNASTKATFKWSHLERTYNRHVLLLVFFEVVFCMIICIGASLYPRNQWYLGWDHQLVQFQNGDIGINQLSELSFARRVEVILTVFGQMIILFAYFVPIDLFLTLEIALFVTWDLDMRLMPDDLRPTSQSAHLLEELGNVTHIYTDKTGTLTKNLMVLRFVGCGDLLIGSSSHGTVYEEDRSRGVVENAGGEKECLPRPAPESVPGSLVSIPPVTSLNLSNEFCSLELKDVLAAIRNTAQPADIQRLRSMLLSFATCHTVLVRQPATAELPELTRETWPPLPPELVNVLTPVCVRLTRRPTDAYWTLQNPPLAIYDASSPDELAFVCTSQALGVEFFRRSRLDRLQLRLLSSFACELLLGPRGAEAWRRWREEAEAEEKDNDCSRTERIIIVPLLEIELLDVLEFDNERKRMSVIISDKLSRIEERVTVTEASTSPQATLQPTLMLYTKGADTHVIEAARPMQDTMVELLQTQVSLLAQQGFRTLLFGERQVSRDDFEDFHRKLIATRTAAVSTNEGDINDLPSLFESMERDLILVGCTGVEDRLQPEVADVIREFRTCDIKFWVLTGDKPETAINIGYSTHLLTPQTHNTVIDGTDRRTLELQLEQLRAVCHELDLVPKKRRKNAERRLVHRAVSLGRRAGHDPINQQQPSRASPAYEITSGDHQTTLLAASWGPCRLPNGGGNLEEGASPQEAVLCSSTALSTLDSDEFFLGTLHDQGDQLIFADCLRDESVSSMLSTPMGMDGPTQQGSLAGSPGLCVQHVLSSETVPGNTQSVTGSSQPVANTLGDMRDSERADRLWLSRLESASLRREESPKLAAEDPKAICEERRYTEFSITVTGAALEEILRRKKLLIQFYRLSRHAAVVLACRVTPKQKCLLVKQSSALNPNCISSLAIGDGANDVAMILAANVGIGISGKEGLQATRAADFGIGEFRFLRKLLLVHGREALRRNSFLIYYGIFKNIAFCVASFSYQFICGFSGQDIYNFWIKSLYATLFVAPTVILYAVFDRELPHYILHHAPTIYRCLAPVMWPVAGASTVMRCSRWWHTMRQCWGCSCCGRRGRQRLPLRKRKSTKLAPDASWYRRSRAFLKMSWSTITSQFTIAWQYISSHNGNRFRSVPIYARSYGNRLLMIWLLYALFVGVIITILPLHVLNHAIPVDKRTLKRDMHLVGEQLGIVPSTRPPPENLKQRLLSESRSSSLIEEGKSGFDLPTVGMVVLFQCIVISNLIVGLAINSLFWFQALIMVGTLALFLGVWALTSWPWLVEHAVTGLQSIRGTYDMILKCPSYHFCVFISIFVCIVPVFSARVFKMLFEPNEVTIIKERMLQGVHDVVVGRRKAPRGELVVLVPQRLPLQRDSERRSSRATSDSALPQPVGSFQLKRRLSRRSSSCRTPRKLIPTGPCSGFAFAYEVR